MAQHINEKMEYRYPYFKDYNTKLLSISSAATVAVVAFAKTTGDKGAVAVLAISIFFLGTSLIAQLLTSFLIYIGTGHEVDGEEKELQSLQDILKPLMVFEIAAALIGIFAAYLFVGANLL